MLVAVVAMSIMSLVNVVTIKNSIDTLSTESANSKPHFELDKSGQNVVVIMLDRAIGQYAPYIFNEKPELKEQYAKYIQNALSQNQNNN